MSATIALLLLFGSLTSSVIGSQTCTIGGQPVPGESSLYSGYNGTAAPFPGNNTAPILANPNCPASPDDLLFQNLLAAEWIIYSFYQQGVEAFTASDFTNAGFPNTTYERITEIRDNEAGHLRIFQEQLSGAVVRPGPCVYDYGFDKDPSLFLVYVTVLEIGSMAFLTGLTLQAKLDVSKAALVAIAEVETRHQVWSLIDIWKVSPFSGPSDTTYPYPNHILEVTNQFVVPSSCPAANPVYPSPRRNLPQLSYKRTGSPLLPGSPITFTYSNATHVPKFKSHRKYYAVFFHGLVNVSVPFNPLTNSSTIPSVFEQKGIIIAVLANTEGAPTEKSVIAGPLIILEQPAGLY